MTVNSKQLTVNGSRAFTLIELLVVMAIMGILATVLVGGFQSSQMRGRDARRKSELKQLSNALELFYNDYGIYPPADSNGSILACPYGAATPTACTWGTGVFSDTKTTYFRKMPLDPRGGQSYFYRLVPSSGAKKYQLFAHLENTQDKDCLSGNCTTPTGIPAGVTCGASTCNFAVTSANAIYSE